MTDYRKLAGILANLKEDELKIACQILAVFDITVVESSTYVILSGNGWQFYMERAML